MPDAIVVRNVTKTFGPKVAVKDLDMVVPEGSLYGFIGPNGAGKTTTIRMIMSILFADRGEISVLGHRSALDAKDRIGYLPEERGVYKKMKVGAFLSYVARLKGMDGAGLGRKVRQWLGRVGLSEVEGKRCEELSKGMQQKIQVLAAVIHEPDLLILDEPFAGLDPVNMRMLREIILDQHRRGATIIFSTHVMIQAEQLCDRVVMIHDGTKVLDESVGAIRAKYDPRVVHFEPLDPGADLSPLQSMSSIEGLHKSQGRWEISLREGSEPGRAMQEIAAAVVPSRVELHRPTLEDVFVQIVRESSGATSKEADAMRASLRDEEPSSVEEAGA